jgi:hypothetical protein
MKKQKLALLLLQTSLLGTFFSIPAMADTSSSNVTSSTVNTSAGGSGGFLSSPNGTATSVSSTSTAATTKGQPGPTTTPTTEKKMTNYPAFYQDGKCYQIYDLMKGNVTVGTKLIPISNALCNNSPATPPLSTSTGKITEINSPVTLYTGTNNKLSTTSTVKPPISNQTAATQTNGQNVNQSPAPLSNIAGVATSANGVPNFSNQTVTPYTQNTSGSSTNFPNSNGQADSNSTTDTLQFSLAHINGELAMYDSTIPIAASAKLSTSQAESILYEATVQSGGNVVVGAKRILFYANGEIGVLNENNNQLTLNQINHIFLHPFTKFVVKPSAYA